MRAGLFLLTVWFVSGCATKHDMLHTYVSKDIQEVIATYGNPVVAFDMEEGRRDFQWVITSYNLSSYPISSGALTEPTKQFAPDVEKETITPMFNGKLVNSECLYTMMTRWNEDAKSWIVTGYQQPTSGC